MKPEILSAAVTLLMAGHAGALDPGRVTPRPVTTPGQTASPPRQAPAIRNSAAQTPTQAPQTNYVNTLPKLIREAQQVVLYAPKLIRADVAEAIRQSLNERGTTTILFTVPENLMSPNSMTFRLMLMGNPTYAVTGDRTPFIILDGLTYTGSGVTNVGPVYQASRERSVTLIRWSQSLVNTYTPLDVTETLKVWTKKNLGITLN